MRKIVLNLALSLDGYIEGPNGEYDWCFTDQDYGMSDFMQRIDAIFMGRKSYEMMQTVEEDSLGFSKLKQYIFSNTLKEVDEGNVLVNGDLKTEVQKIKAEPGKDIWLFGGAGLTQSMLEEDLIDELSLAVHPILLGQGKPLFGPFDDRKYWKLLEVKEYDSGLVILVYGKKV